MSKSLHLTCSPLLVYAHPLLHHRGWAQSVEIIRKLVQTARDIQTQRYSSIRTSNIESSNIVCNADMRIGEVRQFCQLQPDGQSLMRAATPCCA